MLQRWTPPFISIPAINDVELVALVVKVLDQPQPYPEPTEVDRKDKWLADRPTANDSEDVANPEPA